MTSREPTRLLGSTPPSATLAGMVVVQRMALQELRSHRAELPSHLGAVVDDALRVVDPIDFPDSAYETAFHLLRR
jgi:hypothetical protein